MTSYSRAAHRTATWSRSGSSSERAPRTPLRRAGPALPAAFAVAAPAAADRRGRGRLDRGKPRAALGCSPGDRRRDSQEGRWRARRGADRARDRRDPVRDHLGAADLLVRVDRAARARVAQVTDFRASAGAVAGLLRPLADRRSRL